VDELACRCAKFTCSCLYSESDVVTFVARYGVYFRKMLSPVDRSCLFCCSRFGVRLSDIVSINKWFVRACYHLQLSTSLYRTVYVLLELLFVRFGYFSVSCLSHADIVYAVDYICTFKL